jgi:hypothetical protein
MNRLSLVAGAMAVPLVAAVAMAASPSAAPAAGPTATPVAPQASTAPSTQSKTWTADVQPVQIGGSATVTLNADGTGTISLQLSGLVNGAAWTVDVDGGTLDRPNELRSIAYRTGDQVKKVSPDTINIQLTKAEVDAFNTAYGNQGVVIFISDGSRLSAAVISPQS